MASAIHTFNKLSPRLKALYVTSLVLSVALIGFGAVLLTSGVLVGGNSNSTLLTSENYAEDGFGEDLPSQDDNNDDLGYESSTPIPTENLLPTLTPTNYFHSAETTPQPSELIIDSTALPTTNEPSLLSSHSPSDHPSSDSPTTDEPSVKAIIQTNNPTTESPTFLPSTMDPTTTSPTSSNAPTFNPFPTHPEPNVVDSHGTNYSSLDYYYNYNMSKDSKYGPSTWQRVLTLNSTAQNYWSEFGLIENQCNDNSASSHGKKESSSSTSLAQSPIDVCTNPERHCMEHHEFRSKRGDFRINNDEFLTKQILHNKLRVLVVRRVGDEPDPPHADFAGVGAKDLDLLNIDIKFPSEHTVCGRVYDGEMQYYFFHPGKQSLLVVSWLFEVDVDISSRKNEHLQLLIDEFQDIYDANEDACLGNKRRSLEERKLAKNDQKKGGSSIWDPFHRDIQKTIHFWGYTGSLTEPPCSAGTMWRIMDVPVQISMDQLYQMKNILFNNRDSQTCNFTSSHYKGSVARPISQTLKYYKCTRDDYVSDDEREVCGDYGCANEPFGTSLDPYIEPIVYVTGPPSASPTML